MATASSGCFFLSSMRSKDRARARERTGKTVPRTCGAICCPLNGADRRVWNLYHCSECSPWAAPIPWSEDSDQNAFGNQLSSLEARCATGSTFSKIALDVDDSVKRFDGGSRRHPYLRRRPDKSVALSTVEKPAAKMILKAASSSMAASSGASRGDRPFSTARRRSLAASSPLPSSLTSMTTLEPPRVGAERSMRPMAGLPCCARSATVDSTPWPAGCE